MNYFPMTKSQQDWHDRAADIAHRELAPQTEQTDRDAKYHQESLDALKKEGLFGLRVSKEHGGLGEEMLTTCLIVAELSKKYPPPPCATKCTWRPPKSSAAYLLPSK